MKQEKTSLRPALYVVDPRSWHFAPSRDVGGSENARCKMVLPSQQATVHMNDVDKPDLHCWRTRSLKTVINCSTLARSGKPLRQRGSNRRESFEIADNFSCYTES